MCVPLMCLGGPRDCCANGDCCWCGQSQKAQNHTRELHTGAKLHARSVLYGCSLRILQRQAQLSGEALDGCTCTLPGAIGLEPQVANPPAPGRNHAADGTE